jgi:hypothetical protein
VIDLGKGLAMTLPRKRSILMPSEVELRDAVGIETHESSSRNWIDRTATDAASSLRRSDRRRR